MFSFIKYPRMTLRDRQYPVAPHCTSESIRTRSVLHINGSKVILRSPVHWPVSGGPTQISPRIDAVKNGYTSSLPQYGEPRVEYWHYLRRSWAFCGPWLAGEQGDITFTAKVVRPLRLPPEASLLHPEALKFGIMELLEAEHVKNDSGEESWPWVGPINWQTTIDNHGLVSTFITRLEGKEGNDTYYFVRGFDKDKFLVFCFDISRYVEGTQEAQESKISFSNFYKLANEITDSIEIFPSDELQNNIEESKRLFAESAKNFNYPSSGDSHPSESSQTATLDSIQNPRLI